MNTKKIALYFFITIFYIFCVFFIFSISFINIKNKTIRLAIEKHQINSTKLIVEKIYEDLLFDNLIEANRKLNLLKQENIIRDFIILKNNQYLNDDSSYCENIFFDKKNHSAL